MLEGYDEGFRVGLWDLAHLVSSALYFYCMNAGSLIACTLHPPALRSSSASSMDQSSYIKLEAMHKVWCLPTILSSISTIIRYKNNEKKGDGDKKRYNGDASVGEGERK